jgi:signal transduction histidine kinase
MQAAKKEIQISLEFSQNMPEFVKTDQKRVQQIINSLVNNAVKFSKENSIVAVKVDFIDFEDILIIKVIDSGIGI